VIAHQVLKVATVIGSAIGVFLFTMNPNIIIALIVSFPGIVTAMLTLLTYINNKQNHVATMDVLTEVKKQTDGINTKLFAERDKLADDKAVQAGQLSETAQKLAHVEGHEEGRQAGVASEIDREPPK
jgi:hypothetical protein